MLFDPLIARFGAADRNTRLETLLDYSRKLRDLPPELQAARDREEHRVTECQTPVFLWIGLRDGLVALHADVPRESPTVRGFVSLLQHRVAGATPAQVEAIPDDLLDRMGLTETLGMTRTQGLTAILGRVKRSVASKGAR
ncbi:MAG: SufE family protein [Gemmatimonadales bacterium]